ncbi:MAG: hypothetical protein WD928_16540 [Gammaproteobacteria bacterium]
MNASTLGPVQRPSGREDRRRRILDMGASPLNPRQTFGRTLVDVQRSAEPSLAPRSWSAKQVTEMNADEVERCLAVGREALVQFAELVVNGERSRGEMYDRARAEADALISLLDEAPESEHEKIHALLDRYG